MHRRDHPTAADVYEAIHAIDPNVSLGTVYRNLNNMVTRGELMKIAVPNEADHYDTRTHEHQHVKCSHCQKVFDVDMAVPQSFRDKIKKETGFEIGRLHMMGIGLCQKCRNKVKEKL
jgi:Fe2+ or Zn2+ uptake regulation protein